MSPKRKAIAHNPLTMRLHPRDTHANPLFRTRAISSARGPAIPSLGDPAHMRNSGLTCGTEGLRAGQRAQPYTRPTTSHANPLFRTRAISSARGPAIPNLGNTAHMRNSGLTCATGDPHARQLVDTQDMLEPTSLSHADDRSQTMGQPHTPKVQTTSPKNGKNGLFWVRWSAIWANPGTRHPPPTGLRRILPAVPASSRRGRHPVL